MTAQSAEWAKLFLLRTLPLWQGQGFAVAVLSSPNGMSLFGYRHTPAYAATIGQAVDFVHSRANVPVWLVGASQGSTAAVGGGARLGDKIAGIVVTSSITGRSSSGETLFDSEPALVAVPTLIVANTGDVARRRAKDLRRARPRRAQGGHLYAERRDRGPALRSEVAAQLFRH
jgi:pimeloyl-ACP methyl ester carboxylesterase